MKRKRAIVGLGVLALFAMVIVLVWPRPVRPRLSTFQQVQPGMTRDEVHTTVGAPPGDYTDTGFTHAVSKPGTEFWVANDGLLNVTYGEDGRVTKAIAEPL